MPSKEKKVKAYTKHHSQLAFENKLYRALMHVSCVPRTHYFGRVGEYNALVMDQLGSSIDVFFNEHGGKLSVKIVCAIAINAAKDFSEGPLSDRITQLISIMNN